MLLIYIYYKITKGARERDENMIRSFYNLERFHKF